MRWSVTSRPAARKRLDLGRIVGHQPHPRHAEQVEHARGVAEAPLVEAEAEDFICVIGVVAPRLQAIGANLVGEAVAAPFLVEIEDHAAAVFRHVAGGVAQLVAAVAFERAEQIARQAGRMQADMHGTSEIGLSDDHRRLVAQALAAAKHDDFRLRRAFERHGRAAHELQRQDFSRGSLDIAA